MTAFMLKLIASAAMLIDHTGAVLDPFYNTIPLRVAGRMAFPIYAFLIAEGCRHTKDIKKYLSRLLAFAVVSEVPFDLLYSLTEGPVANRFAGFDISHQNVFFTLFLGALAICLYEIIKPKNSVAAVFPFFLCALAAYVLKTDYGAAGVGMIFAAYVFKNKILGVLSVFAGVFCLYAVEFEYSALGLWLTAAGGVACVLLLAYNGKRGRNAKWFFYLFYPAHMLAIFLIFYIFNKS